MLRSQDRARGGATSKAKFADLHEKVSSGSILIMSYFGCASLKETNDALLALSSNPNSTPSQSMSHAIQQHREVYQDYVRELQRPRFVFVH
jgi:hypothetical protein